MQGVGQLFVLTCLIALLCASTGDCRSSYRNSLQVHRKREPNVVGARPSKEHRLIHPSLIEPEKWASRQEIEELLKQKQSYLDITGLRPLPALDKTTRENAWTQMVFPIPSALKYEESVNRRIGAVQKERIKEFIEDLTSYASRLAINALGHDSEVWLHSNIIKPLILEYPSASVEESSVEYDQEESPFIKQKNLLVRIGGTDPILKEEIVIIGAHLDSISFDGKACLTPECLNKHAPGADDNASGCAVLVEVLRILSESGYSPKRTTELHFYAGGEFGLRGSLAAAAQYREQGKKVVGMLCLDMVGFGTGPIAVQMQETNPRLTEFVKLLIDKYLGDVGWKEMEDRGSLLSDYISWSAFAYPAAYVSESSLSPNVHTEQDKMDTSINVDYIAEFVKLALGFLVEFGEPSGDEEYYDGEEGDYDGWFPLRPFLGAGGNDSGGGGSGGSDGGKRLIVKNWNTPPEWMTSKLIKEYMEKSKAMNFLDITDTPQLRERASKMSQQRKGRSTPGTQPKCNCSESSSQIPSQTSQKELTTNLIQKLQKERITRTLESSMKYRNRLGEGVAGQDFVDHFYQNVLNQIMRSYSGLYYMRKIDVVRDGFILPQKNLVVHIEGDEKLGHELVILGAHLDSIAMETDPHDPCLTYRCLTKSAPGIDDNMSGVSVIYEALAVLVESGQRPSRSIEFHFYGNEEGGMFGSGTLVDQYANESKIIAGYLNFDVVGYAPTKDSMKIAIHKQGTNQRLNDLVKLLLDTYVDIPNDYSKCEMCQSGWLPYWIAGYPAAFISEWELTPFIHSKNDTIETVNIDYILNFAKVAVAWITELGELSQSPPKPKNCTELEFYGSVAVEPQNRTKGEPAQRDTPRSRRSRHYHHHIINRKSIGKGGHKPGARIILTDMSAEPKTMTEEELIELRKTKNYLDITADPSARSATTTTKEVPVPTRFQYSDLIRNFVRKRNTGIKGIEKCVNEVSEKFPNRFWRKSNGKEVSDFVRDKIQSYINDNPSSGTCMAVFEKEQEWSQRTVIFRILGADKQRSSEVIILGSHLDSWSPDCAKNPENCKAPGADDNASGMCLLLKVASAMIAANFIPERTIELHWYSASEAGLKGAYSIASFYKKNNVNVVGMFNFDSIGGGGQTNNTRIGLQRKGTNPVLAQFLKSLIEKYAFLPSEDSDISENKATDFMAWSIVGFPTAHLHEVTENPGIHSVNDLAKDLSYTPYLQFYFKLALALVFEYGRVYNVRTALGRPSYKSVEESMTTAVPINDFKLYEYEDSQAPNADADW